MGPKVCPSFSIYLPFQSEVAQTTFMDLPYYRFYTNVWSNKWLYHGNLRTLHKDFVKIPYRSSNKKNVETQLLQIVSI